MKKRILCMVLVAVFVFGSLPVSAMNQQSYTYTYDFWGVPIPSPDAYRVSAYILGQHLEFNGENVGAWRMPQDMQVWGNRLYLLDSGNNRVVVFNFFGENYTEFEVVEIVEYVTMPNGEQSGFNNPHGIFVSPWAANEGQKWIADTQNQRVLHVDENWNVLTVINHPGIYGTSLLDVDSNFLPSKVVVDFSGRIFVQVRHVNTGLMEFDRYGVFAGYMGAPDVVMTPWERFWRMIATQEQRERRQLFVPVEYNNITIDHEGFIFATTASEDVDPVVRLNAMGDDVMIRNGFFDPIGDLWTGTGADISGESEFIDVTALPNGTFVAFDGNRGRLFAYDTQGNLLYVWGGPMNRVGFFTLPTAVGSMEYTIFALDAGRGDNFAALTVFTLTEYGALINEALDMYHRGLYEESYYVWHEVLRINGNFGLAYIGIARALLRQGYYREAMRYFRLQHDNANFGRAFGFYRRIWMEENFWMFAVALGVLMIVPPVVKKVLKIRREIKES